MLGTLIEAKELSPGWNSRDRAGFYCLVLKRAEEILRTDLPKELLFFSPFFRRFSPPKTFKWIEFSLCFLYFPSFLLILFGIPSLSELQTLLSFLSHSPNSSLFFHLSYLLSFPKFSFGNFCCENKLLISPFCFFPSCLFFCFRSSFSSFFLHS